jgi:hypothetical protein
MWSLELVLTRGRDVDWCAAAWRRPFFFAPRVAWLRRAVFLLLPGQKRQRDERCPLFSRVVQPSGVYLLPLLLAQQQPSWRRP